MVENSETELLGILKLMDVGSLTCACGILGLDVSEQKKGNRKLLLKHILRKPNSEDEVLEGSDDAGSWYTKLLDHLRWSFSKTVIALSV